MSYKEKVLMVFDFDNTIINCNSDQEVKALSLEPIPEEVEALSHVKNGWTQYMQALFIYLYQKGVTRKDYEELLKRLPLVEEMGDMMKRASPDKTCVVIISDANSFFIDTILKHHGIRVDKVLTNLAEFDQNGCLVIRGFHNSPGQTSCRLCPPNLCKGEALEMWKRSEGGPFSQTFFIADGSGDVCLALRLGKSDQVFARQGYSLLRKLEKMPLKDIKFRLTPWKTVTDIIKN